MLQYMFSIISKVDYLQIGLVAMQQHPAIAISIDVHVDYIQ